LLAHGALAALAFVILFPMGAIMIRLASFPRMWLVHGLFQVLAYTIYFAAFVLGLWLVLNIPVSLLGTFHPIIGIICFCLLFFQPITGFMHHHKYKNVGRRTWWSHAHLWTGRTVITLGMINGGLGFLLARNTDFFVPKRMHVLAYGVVAGLMWLVWVLTAVLGEKKRAQAQRMAVQPKTTTTEHAPKV
jgi:hypothetical protein